MKITGFRTETFNYSRGRRIGDANGVAPSDRATASLLFIETDENITGIAMGGSPAIPQVFRVVEGQDPRSTVGLWKTMADFVFKTGNEGQNFSAVSTIDAALWDIKAKAAGEPLWRLLGAKEPRVKAYASGLDIGLSDDELAGFYQRFADLGVDAGKLKVGLDIDADIRRLGIVRDVLSRNARRPHLMIDSNEYWSPKQAIRYISMIEEKFDLTWAEEPARRWDYRGLRKVSQAVRTAVATGENINGLDEYYALVHNEAVDVVQFGSGAGITVPLQVANFAYGYELPVSVIGSPGNPVAHAAAAMPNHIMQEVKDFGPPPCIKIDNYLADGYIHLGNEPGFGITVDEALLAEMQKPENAGEGRFTPLTRRRGAALLVAPPQPGEGVFGA